MTKHMFSLCIHMTKHMLSLGIHMTKHMLSLGIQLGARVITSVTTRERVITRGTRDNSCSARAHGRPTVVPGIPNVIS